jgi:spore coat polysaccharide biosynthesis predicted glycosyltransferase SpsG
MGHLLNSATLHSELKLRLINCKRDLVVFDAPYVQPFEVIRARGRGAKTVTFYSRGPANYDADICVCPTDSGLPPHENLREVRGHTIFFHGPRYRILREEFRKKYSYPLRNRVLIMLGGTDVLDLAQTVQETIGAASEVANNASSIAEWLSCSALAIVSPGFSVWEALYVGTPIIIIPQNEEQVKTYGKSFPLLMPDQIHLLSDLSQVQDRIVYPGAKYEIGEGAAELLEEILR